jgi:uncharacterized protein (TIGR02145 family)
MKKNFLFILPAIAIVAATFKSTAQVTAHDGTTYKTVKISTQEWMAENLNEITFNNGDPIPEAKTDEEWKKLGEEGKPAWCYYENKPENATTYGILYNFFAVKDLRGIAPKGWHIPAGNEWETLINNLGGEYKAGKKMRSQNGWLDKENGTNESNFTALPGGSRSHQGDFSPFGKEAVWWSKTVTELYGYPGPGSLAVAPCILTTSDAEEEEGGWGGGVKRVPLVTSYMGLSIRCIKD